MLAPLAEALRLVAVTDDRVLQGRDLVGACEAAVRGGATMVQLRLKEASPRDLGRIARELTRRLAVPVVVNDRLDVALAVGAQGVHLGADDISPGKARPIAPAGFWIGASVGTPDEVAAGLDADYWGVGPWRSTGTKADAGTALGRDGFRALVARSGGRPCVAIGAVRPEDVPSVVSAGGVGVAVVSGIFGETDVEEAARRYRTGRP
jgi:thiamine-phosphate diphosphorylase